MLSNDELAFIVFGRWMGPMKGRTHTQSGSVRAYVHPSLHMSHAAPKNNVYRSPPTCPRRSSIKK